MPLPPMAPVAQGGTAPEWAARTSMGNEGGSAERRARELAAQGDVAAGAWAAGAEGERRVAEALASLGGAWTVLHDRLLRPGLSEANLDHLVAGPAGVLLIDAKNWSGHVRSEEHTSELQSQFHL